MFVPIFEKDGNKLFVCLEDFTGQTKDDAMKIGWGASLVECALMEMKFTGDVKEINAKSIPHRKANISSFPVAIVSGPLFENAEK